MHNTYICERLYNRAICSIVDIFVYTHNVRTVGQTTGGEGMKGVFTSNWYTYRVCLPSIFTESRVQRDRGDSK